MTAPRLPRWRLRALTAAIAAIAVVLLLIRPMVPGWVASYRTWRTERAIRDRLRQPLPMPFPGGTSLGNVLIHIKASTKSGTLPDGIPIFLDPIGLQEAGASLESTVAINTRGEPIEASLKAILDPLGLTFYVAHGLVSVTSKAGADVPY